MKYLFAGGAATVVQFVVLHIAFKWLGLHIALSAGAAFICAFLISFTSHKFWTFRDNDRQGMFRQAYLFFLIGLAGLGINSYAMYLLVEKYLLWHIWSQAIVSGCLAVCNFLLLKFLIFGRVRVKERSKKEERNYSGRKNILIATGIYPPDIGGPAGYVKKLLKKLPELGLEVKVITYADNAKSESVGKEQISRISRRQNIFLRYYKYFLAVGQEIDRVYKIFVQDAVSAGLPTAAACYLNNREYILKIVGDHSWEQGRQRFGVSETIDEFQDLKLNYIKKKYTFGLYLMRYIQFKVALQAETVIVPSRYLKGIVKKWGVPEKKIKVIYNSVSDPDPDKWGRQKARAEYCLDGFVILSAGRLVPWKGFDGLIRAVSDLALVDEEVKLVIVGSGPLEHELKKQVQDLGLNDHVQFTGKMPQKELWQYMRAADIFALNTGYEGLPHIIIEAMKNGLPVITTDVGGNPEVIKDGQNGLLVKYGDHDGLVRAIASLYDEGEREKFAKAALGSLGKFTDEKMVEDLGRALF
jgi:glycosyltransferase involved in cell wall biosynthesis/putative flippase GtrA